MNGKPIRVLLADDDEGMFVLVSSLLQHSTTPFEVNWSPTAGTLQALEREGVDVCLLDDCVEKPAGHTAVDILLEARRRGVVVPIIVLTNSAGDQIDMHAVQAGASDYMAKTELNARLLERSVRYAIERNRINAALRSSEERVHRILTTAPVLLFELNREGIVTFVAGTALRVLKLRAEDLLGRSAFEIYPVMEAQTRLALAGRPFTVTVEINGAVLESHVAPTLDEAGQVTGAVGVATDITRRVRNERALRTSKLELQAERDFTNTILDTMGSLAIVLDRSGHIVRFNRACEQLSGYREEEVKGRCFWEIFVLEEELEEIVHGFEELVDGRFPSSRDNYWRTRDGELRLVSWANTAITNVRGEVEFVVATGIDVTARDAAERALRDSQHLFRTFMDHSSAAAFIKDLDLRYAFVNQRFCDAAGLEAADVLGRTDTDLFPPEFARAWEDADRETIESGCGITRVDAVSGDRHFLTTKFLVKDAANKMLVAGQSIEITERVRAELSLRKSEERFQLAAKATNDAIWDWDLSTNTLWWNANVHQLFRYQPDVVDVTLDWWGKRLHPDDHDHVVESLEAAIRLNEQFWTCEYRFLCGDGQYAYVLDRGYVMRDNQGRPVRMIGAMTDFTTRRRTEDALRSSEERYRRIVETAQEGIVMLDVHGAITFTNARMADMLGYTVRKLQGMPFGSLIDDGDAEVGAMLMNPGQERESFRVDVRLVREDRSVVWTRISFSPLVEPDGNVTGTLGMISDITARKQAERALQDAHDQLEMRVAERTAEIVDMMARLEQAHQVTQRFVADASHDLRTPLTVVRAELDLLLEHAEHDVETRASLMRIATESRRLENMASDLLLLATIDAQRGIVLGDVVQLDDLLFECMTQLQTVAREKDIAWHIDVAEPLTVRCNASMIRRVLTNVLENALKYSDAGSTINVLLATAGSAATVSIRDTGVGITPRDLPRVFDRFYRGDQTRNTTGTGLGLAIVKAVVEGHGGAVAVESQLGKGTMVKIDLPLVPGADGWA